MKLETSLVDIESIHFEQTPGEFKASHIERAANSIATIGSMITIPIVRFLDIDEYQLISHFFEYQSFLKARDFNPEMPDRIRVFIAKKETEAALLDQVTALQPAIHHPTPASSSVVVQSENSHVEQELYNLKASIERLVSTVDVSNEQQTAMQSTLTSLVDAQPKPLPMLQAFNQIDQPEVQQRLADAFKGNKKINKIIARVQVLKREDPRLTFHSLTHFLDKLGKETVGKKQQRYLTETSLMKLMDQWPM